MCNPGVKEKPNLPWTGTLATFKEYRAKGAPIGFAPDPRTGHECGDSRYLAIPFFDACLAMRLPDKGSKDQTLKPVDQSHAWLATPLSDQAVPAASYQGNPNEAVWLPNEAVAKAWMEYVKTGAVSDTTPPPAPYDVKATDQGEQGTQIDVERRRGLRERHPLFHRACATGRSWPRCPRRPSANSDGPLFQSMTYHDTPAQPLPKMQYVDASTKPGEKHAYTVVTVNSVGLKSEPSAPATTTTSSQASSLAAGNAPAGGGPVGDLGEHAESHQSPARLRRQSVPRSRDDHQQPEDADHDLGPARADHDQPDQEQRLGPPAPRVPGADVAGDHRRGLSPRSTRTTWAWAAIRCGPIDLGWLRKEGGSYDPYRKPMRYAFPCLKPVGQIILGIDPLAGAEAPHDQAELRQRRRERCRWPRATQRPASSTCSE